MEIAQNKPVATDNQPKTLPQRLASQASAVILGLSSLLAVSCTTPMAYPPQHAHSGYQRQPEPRPAPAYYNDSYRAPVAEQRETYSRNQNRSRSNPEIDAIRQERARLSELRKLRAEQTRYEKELRKPHQERLKDFRKSMREAQQLSRQFKRTRDSW